MPYPLPNSLDRKELFTYASSLSPEIVWTSTFDSLVQQMRPCFVRQRSGARSATGGSPPPRTPPETADPPEPSPPPDPTPTRALIGCATNTAKWWTYMANVARRSTVDKCDQISATTRQGP